MRVPCSSWKCLGCSMMLAWVLFFTCEARANTVSVGCPGSSGVFDFATINDAVSFLSGLGKKDHAVIISGACTEIVSLDDWDDLRLIGTTGAAILAPADPAGHIGIIEIHNSKKMFVSGLRLHGNGTSGPNPMHVDESTVEVFQCMLENGGILAGGGMFVQGHSTVHVHASVVQNNSPNGIRVDGPASVQLGDVDPGAEPTPTIIQNNDTGIQARGSGLVAIHGKTTIQNNGVGVSVNAGEAVLCCEDGQRQVLNNVVGISVITGGRLETIGPVLVQGNPAFGISLIGGNATMGSGNTVRQNGRGIQVRTGSSLRMLGGTVANNSVVGIVVRDHSSAILNATISGNGAGVRVLLLSTVAVASGSIQGNLGSDFVCSPDSFGYGDKTLIDQLHCPNFGVDPLPGPD